MDRYKVTKVLGDGTYGSVVRADNKKTGEVVAIKKMKRKFHTWDECMALREVKSLRKLSHPNIVKLREVIRENNELQLVFEYMETNLYTLIKDRAKGLPEKKVRNVMYQLIQGLGYMHKHGYFHRDIKPENLLVTGDCVKLADFGLVREIRARPPFTDYVSTRWYRAPEVILRMPVYSCLVDLWAVGALMAELYTLRPLFPGSSETDQMQKICSVLGTPTRETWREGVMQAQAIGFRLNQFVPVPFDSLVPQASHDGRRVMQHMLAWNPSQRLDAVGALQHRYFQDNLGDVCPQYVGLLVGAPGAASAAQREPSQAPGTDTGSMLRSDTKPRVPSATHRRTPGSSGGAHEGSNVGGLPSITGAPRVPSNGSAGSRGASGSSGRNRARWPTAPKYPGAGGPAGGMPGVHAYLAQQSKQPWQAGLGGLAATQHPPAQAPAPSPFAAQSGTAPAGMGRAPGALGSLGGLGGGGGLGQEVRNVLPGPGKSAFASAGRSLFGV